jgi:hypothetical protein
VALCLLLAGCGRNGEQADKAEPRTLVEEMARGPIAVRIEATPAAVDLKRDVILKFEVTSPSEVEVVMPELGGRLEGFVLGGVFADDPSTQEGRTTRVLHARLSPLLADTYRLAPVAVVYTDRSTSPAKTGWFPTRPLVFDQAPPVRGSAAKDIEEHLNPIWVYPPFKTVAAYVVMVIGLLAAGILAFKLLGRLRRKIELMRMSPRERALRELDLLLARDLIAKDKVKQFYLELTMIVRRYIERRHTVRAPEQTTEEFLAAAARHPRFSPEVLSKLRAFLEAADLVKFAAHRPEGDAVETATRTARDYIETDSPAAPDQNRQ